MPWGYDPPRWPSLIIFVGLTTLTAGAIGGAVAAGTTTGVVVALVVHLVGTVIVIGATLGGARPRRQRLTPLSAYRWRRSRRVVHSLTIQTTNAAAITNQTTKKSDAIDRA